MTRRKLSEYRSKLLVSSALGLEYVGWSIDCNAGELTDQIATAKSSEPYVLKVDQGVKGRFKKGLVRLGLSRAEIESALSGLNSKGYSKFILEPQVTHDNKAERYLALSHDKTGVYISYSAEGGVDIEQNADSIVRARVNGSLDWDNLAQNTKLPADILKNLVRIFDEQYMTMLEINPYIADADGVRILDLAIEVDDAASYFTDRWSESDFRNGLDRTSTDEETAVRRLDEKSPASLKLEVINPNGAIFLLLSGGGASVVVADEICNLGLGRLLGNYGEYSGNPNTEETYIYTREVLSLLLKSSANKKVLFIGGAVANFTDVASTFKGIIMAIDEMAESLIDQNVKVFVRRGGPGQDRGLANMSRALAGHGLLGAVHDPDTTLTDAVAEAVKEAV